MSKRIIKVALSVSIILLLINYLFLYYKLYLSFKSNLNLIEEEIINKNGHLNLDRRNLKDAKDVKSYSFKFSKKLMDKFKIECAKTGEKGITVISNFENHMLNYSSRKGVKSNA